MTSRPITLPILITGGASALCLVTGVAFAIDATSKKSSYSSSPSGETGNAGERSSFYADISFGAAALLGITAAALYFIRDDDDASNAPPKAASLHPRWIAAPAVLSRGAGVSAAVQF